MMFKERWGFVTAVFVTAMVVYFMPLGNLLTRKCNCPKKDCPTSRPAPQPPPKNLIIYSKEELKNKTFSQLEQMHRKSNENVQSRRADLERPGWVLDCITWDPKWESPTLDADPHPFTMDNIPGNKLDGENDKHREDTFAQVFKSKDWPAKDPSYNGLQASGPGAMLKNTQAVMAALHVIITKLKQRLMKPTISILDLPCGDLQWMKRFLVTRNDVLYTGADIVPDIIDYHKKQHGNLHRVKFIQHDIVKSPLNESYDLIICRDMLQHLWKYDAMKALYHFSISKSSYLLATTFPDTSHNEDVEKDALGGRKFSYNLELPPFSLAPPICSSYDWNIEHISLWEIPLKQKYEF